MGEMADFYLDSADWAELNHAGRRKFIQCCHCGERWLRWAETDDGWRLFNEEGELHNCRQQPASVDDFEDVS